MRPSALTRRASTSSSASSARRSPSASRTLVGQREHALHVGLRRAWAHDPGPRLAAEQQIQRVREHGLARPGLPREHVQARPETELGPLDQQEVLDAEFVEHALGSTSGGRRNRGRHPFLRRFVAKSAQCWCRCVLSRSSSPWSPWPRRSRSCRGSAARTRTRRVPGSPRPSRRAIALTYARGVQVGDARIACGTMTTDAARKAGCGSGDPRPRACGDFSIPRHEGARVRARQGRDRDVGSCRIELVPGAETQWAVAEVEPD